MTGYRALLEKEIIEAWRTRRIVLASLLFGLLGLATPILTRYLPELTRAFAPPDFEIGLGDMGTADVVDNLLAGIGRFGPIVAILAAMGSFAGERARGTAAFVLSKPVSRFAYVWAKLVALGMLLGLATVVWLAGAWLVTAVAFEAPEPLAWVQLGMVAWLTMLVVAAITLLGSAFAPSPAGAAAFGVAGLVGLWVTELVPTVAPWLPSGLLGVARAVALEEVSPDLHPAAAISTSLVVVLACVLLAAWRVRREEP